ncbi:glycosyltransferase family 1 protein [Bacillus sp. JJ1122]|uniref:glycosyltransferase family 1 protein n=1 Tax=Bacillus sp. JJ1122 TaxID=3122951 RepID=UPI002FFF5E29
MGSPIRVLHVVVNMNRGGAETLLMNLYRNIDRSKIQFDFLTCKEGVFDQEIIELGGKVHRIPYITEVGHSEYIRALKLFFSENPNYKIVHSHMDKMSGFPLRAAKQAGIPVRIAHSHSTRSEGGIIASTYKWFAGNMITKYATNFVACSKEAADWLFKHDSKQALILKNGIQSDKFQFSMKKRKENRDKLEVPIDHFAIGHVGRFSAPKNHFFLLEIFKDFLVLNENAILLLVGDGPLLPEVKKKAEEMELSSKVKFLGNRDDVDCVLQTLDLFLFPSLFEGFPVSVMEAQGSGIPCLISDCITKDVDLGSELLNFLPLKNKKAWLDKMMVIKNKGFNRNSHAHLLISKNGYDIKSTSKHIQTFYTTITG